MPKIESMLDDFQEKFGIVFKKNSRIKVISTSFKKLDDSLQIGGFPEGKIIEVSGSAGVGKTILAYNLIKEAQIKHKSILYISSDKDFSPDFAVKMGVDLDRLLICDVPSGEAVFDIIKYNLDRDLLEVIILDSLASLVSSEEIENNRGDYLQQANMIEILLNNLFPYIEQRKITMLCLNQIRMNLDTKKLQTPFDKIMAYYSSIRIVLSKAKSIKKDRILLGYNVEAKIYKNNYGKLNTVNFDMLI